VEWIDYFLDPYRGYSNLDIGIEVVAVVFGLLSVYYARLAKIAVYPTGIISTSLYIHICLNAKLYADMGINAYFMVMSFYGWYVWLQEKPDEAAERPILRLRRDEYPKLFAALLLAWAVLAFVLLRFTDSDVPYIDATTTSLFFVGMYFMARKNLEHWWLWIIGDAISIPLYVYKGLGLTAFQYLVFLYLAIMGLKEWKATISNQSSR
jgi:nicotinamide mononucleotide transporter